jgi:hypothetical protein
MGKHTKKGAGRPKNKISQHKITVYVNKDYYDLMMVACLNTDLSLSSIVDASLKDKVKTTHKTGFKELRLEINKIAVAILQKPIKQN